MKARLVKVARYLAYPAFYLFCLAFFGYFTFPYNRLKDRLIAEFDRTQQRRSESKRQRLEIDSLDAYWLTGVEATGVRLILPPSQGTTSRQIAMALDSGSKDKAEAPKPSVIEIDEGHARVQIFPLLLGRIRVDFWVSIFGGEAEGMFPIGKSGGAVELEAEGIDLSKVEPLSELLGGVPLHGTVAATLELEAGEGKFNKANGSLELTATGVSVGDGKTKIQGLIALPRAKLNELVLSAEAKDGVLKVTRLQSSEGADLELIGEGKVNVREPWQNSNADLFVRFKFSDAYRSKNDTTKSLLGEPGSKLPALIEVQIPKMKRAKRADSFYGFHAHGQLKRLRFDPQTSDAPATKSRGKGVELPFGPNSGRKIGGGIKFPLGPSEAKKPKDEPAPPPPPAATPEEQPPPREPPPTETQPSEPAPSEPSTEPQPAPEPEAPPERVQQQAPEQ